MGGAIVSTNQVTISIDNCTFDNNHAVQGGALFFSLAVNYRISNSLFFNNTAQGYGSAIYITSLDGVSLSSLSSPPPLKL